MTVASSKNFSSLTAGCEEVQSVYRKRTQFHVTCTDVMLLVAYLANPTNSLVFTPVLNDSVAKEKVRKM